MRRATWGPDTHYRITSLLSRLEDGRSTYVSTVYCEIYSKLQIFFCFIYSKTTYQARIEYSIAK